MKIVTKNTAQLKAEVNRHVEADAVIQGLYWDEADNAVGGRGCFVGCLAHSSDADVLAKLYGLPAAFVRFAEHLFEQLGESDAVQFFKAIPDAVDSDGKDLRLIHWQFLADALEGLPMPESQPGASTVRTSVIDTLRLLAAGKVWHDREIIGVGNPLYNELYDQLSSYEHCYDSELNEAEYHAMRAVYRACRVVQDAESPSLGLIRVIDSVRSVIATHVEEQVIEYREAAKLMADLLLAVIRRAPVIEGETA